MFLIFRLILIVSFLFSYKQASAMHMLAGDSNSNIHRYIEDLGTIDTKNKSLSEAFSDVFEGAKIFIKTPSKAALTKMFKESGLDSFIQKTTIIDDLADGSLEISVIANACQMAFNQYARYLRSSRLNEEAIFVATRYVYGKVNDLIREILSGYPGALDRLTHIRAQGRFFVSKL